MKSIILLCGFFLVLGCSHGPEEKKKSFLDYPGELEQVHNLITERKTVDARNKIEDYLNKAENIHWYGHAYFLMGFLYELDDDFANAIKFYRSAIEHGSQYESKVEAKALYNLSFVFERTDARDKLLTSLIDLMKRRQFFDVLTGQVEIPARLAAAYASQAKWKEARIFHREAERNFQDMVRSSKFHASHAEISKSLYYLGLSTFDQNNESFDELIKKLKIGQKYFLASAEASKSPWSEKAVNRLNSQYNKAWGMIQEYSPKGFEHDPMARKKQMHRRQLLMASNFYDLMFELQAEEFPMSQVNPRSKELTDAAKSWANKIERFAMSLRVGPEMIRNKKIKNKRLAKYVEVEKIKVNKEQAPAKKQSHPAKKSEVTPLPEKENIGKDPNL